jgi:FtsP/CotA-like multicopper oxidase with cupredoxin domain
MSRNRRDFFARVLTGAAALWASPARAQQASPPVQTPDLPDLEPRLVDGVKEFHLVAEPVRTELIPGRVVDGWGYNGSIPGPTIQVNEGDRVRVIFENHLPEMTAIHWHGFEVPMTMDGSVGLGQNPIQPGERFVYEFTLNQNGTLFYHSHFAMQEMMGMLGLFVVHPKTAYAPKVDRDFGILLQEWAILPNNTVPNTMAMEFNWVTFNGRAGPDTTPMLVKQGERVRIRIVNLGMDHHPIHLHGNQFVVTGTEGGRKPESLWFPENTVLVGVAQARNIEFDAKFVGDWMLHCHLPHHMMNQMVSMVGPISKESPHAMHTRNFYPVDDPAKKKVPGYPQDMWMTMDAQYQKPETYGLPPGWTGAMMGMMTLIRVLPPDLFDKIQELKRHA